MLFQSSFTFKSFAYGNGACPSCGGSQLSALTDPKGNTWSFSYDQYGRLADTANPLGQKKAYQYDKMSRVTEVKDPAGNVTTLTYDALNRLTRRDIQTPSGEHAVTSYVYDKVGNLLSVSNADGLVSFAYDELNRPVKTEQTFGGRTHALTYAYDAVGNRTAMTAPWGTYSYTYDALNQLTDIVDPQKITVSFGYDAVGRRTSKKIFKSAPGLLAETDYSYDKAGQLLAITNKAGGKVVAFDNYTYDAAGNRVRKEDENGIWNYGYDASNRLITAVPEPKDMVKAEAFVYDRNGNRRFDKGAWDYKYDAANRLLENSTYTYTHDLNGNLTGRTNKNDNTTITYAYNPEQKLSEVITPEHNVQYKYDPLGRRIGKTVDGETTRYVYDNEDIIAVLDGTNHLTETYTNGPGIDEPLIMSKADGKTYYYHADALGSITAITDDNGKLVETYHYKAYGQPTIKNAQGNPISSSTVDNTRMFAAREYEAETGLYYNRARYLDPARGAFTQSDKLGFMSGQINLYAYAKFNPAVYSDPTGNFPMMRIIWNMVLHPLIDAQTPKNDAVVIGIRKVDVKNLDLLPHAYIRVGKDTYSFVPGESIMTDGNVLKNEPVDSNAVFFLPTGLSGQGALNAAHGVLDSPPVRAWNPVYNCHVWSMEMILRIYYENLKNAGNCQNH